MTRSLRSTTLGSAALASVLLLAACGKSPPAAAPAPSPASTVPMPAAPSPPATGASAAPPAAGSAASAAAVAPATSSAATAAPAAPSISVAKVTLGDAVNAAHQVTHPGDRFAASDKIIYASVATEGRNGGATLNAKWSYLEGQGQLVSSISQAIATDGPAITTFKVQNPDLWPAGKYQVEISLDGKAVAKQGFEIKKS